MEKASLLRAWFVNSAENFRRASELFCADTTLNSNSPQASYALVDASIPLYSW